MKGKSLHLRAEPDDKLTYRTLALAVNDRGIPETLDEDTRSVEVVGSTENPVEVFDWERWEIVQEVLLMSGAELPENRQIPLIDAHDRTRTANVLGSYRNMKIRSRELVGRTFFSTVPEAESPWTKVREGHLTDFSVGYRVFESYYIPAGEKQTIKGRTYEGPIKVSTRWAPKELSIVPIGADKNAKARTETEIREVKTMNKKLRAFLESRGLPKDATEDEAWEFLGTLEVPGQRIEVPMQQITPAEQTTEAKKTEVDAEKERDAGAHEERERIMEINAMCKRFGCDEMAEDLVNLKKSIAESRKAVLDHIAKKEKESDDDIGYRVAIEMGKEQRDKFREAAADSLIIRCGGKIEKPAPGAMELAGFSLKELARECLRNAGIRPDSDVRAMVGRAMTTSDFPYLLANVANKALFEGWETNEETWPVWVATGSVSDFKTNYSPRISESSDLEEVPEDTEYKYGKRTEAQETYTIATYGKIFPISRQLVINDDLNALSDIPRAHGEAASRKVGDVVYAVLTANAAMGDTVALFHNASHGNLAAGGDVGLPGIATIAAAILAMKSQKDLQALRRLNIRPEYFIAPVAQEGASEVFFRSERFVDSDTVATDSSLAATRVNPYSGTYFTRIYEARLDDDSTTAWYLAARKGRTVKLFFLNGIQAPYLEVQNGWTVDGAEHKVRIDCGAKAMDWRGLYKNAGA